VLVAMGAELIQFDAIGGVAAVFGGSVTGNPGSALVRIGATLGTF